MPIYFRMAVKRDCRAKKLVHSSVYYSKTTVDSQKNPVVSVKLRSVYSYTD